MRNAARQTRSVRENLGEVNPAGPPVDEGMVPAVPARVKGGMGLDIERLFV